VENGRLDDRFLTEVDRRLAAADAALAARYPGDPGTRQPVHTVYVPADAYAADTVAAWGHGALEALDRHAPDAAALAAATAMDARAVADVHALVRAKLAREPIEDLRVDFEDGYGTPGDAAEDAVAAEVAAALAMSVSAGAAAPFVGIRVKSMELATRRRALRTLDLVVSGLLDGAAALPPAFVVTFPKVTSVDQVAAMVMVCERLEAACQLPAGQLRFEIQVETPQAVLGPDGTATLARMIHAAGGRCAGLHYGTYDYSAALGVAAAYQTMEHPVADHAKAVMQLAAAGTGVRVSDGSSNVLPVGHRAAVHSAWRQHARLVRRSLERGYYQGWDLHPAQLPIRFLATYAFFREGLPAVAARLRAYTERSGSAVADEPATAQALAGHLVRGLDCGAITAAEAQQLTGLSRAGLDALHQCRNQRPNQPPNQRRNGS
jgi:HpcH/HpaI aldolase/citrate lyase family